MDLLLFLIKFTVGKVVYRCEAPDSLLSLSSCSVVSLCLVSVYFWLAILLLDIVELRSPKGI